MFGGLLGGFANGTQQNQPRPGTPLAPLLGIQAQNPASTMLSPGTSLSPNWGSKGIPSGNYTHSKNGMPYDPTSGFSYDPNSGQVYHDLVDRGGPGRLPGITPGMLNLPYKVPTPEEIQNSIPPGNYTSTWMGMPYDPNTGKAYDPKTGVIYDDAVYRGPHVPVMPNLGPTNPPSNKKEKVTSSWKPL